MAFTDSTVTSEYTELSGRRYANVLLRHHTGKESRATIRVIAGQTAALALAAFRPTFEATAVEDELQANWDNAISDDAPAPTFEWCTKLEFAAVLRERFRATRGRDAARLAWYVNQFGLTDPQLRNLFGLTVAQLTAFKSRMAVLAGKYTDILDQVGE